MKWSKLCDLNREQVLSINLMTLVVFEDSFVEDAFPSLIHSRPWDQVGLFMRKKDFFLKSTVEIDLRPNPTPIVCAGWPRGFIVHTGFKLVYQESSWYLMCYKTESHRNTQKGGFSLFPLYKYSLASKDSKEGIISRMWAILNWISHLQMSHYVHIH